MTLPLHGRRILVTGGTGSLGQTLIRRLLTGVLGVPDRIIVLSRDEAKQYAMKTRWKHAEAATDEILYHNFDDLIQFVIADVRDPVSIERAVRQADVVFHAAAMKQVPTCEYFPDQAVATNVTGASNVVRAVRAAPSVELLVGISTDKACKPVNVMGMTKALQERVLIEGNLHQDHCRAIAVRYGNVLSSRGSVIPLFRHQIAEGGPVTITVPEMTRFLLSLDRAVDAIFAGVHEARAGEIYIPKCPAARILDVARVLIGDQTIDVVETGIRPGEKLHEILVSEEEASRTELREDHYVIHPALPELAYELDERPLTSEYSSADGVITGTDLEALVAQSAFVDAAAA